MRKIIFLLFVTLVIMSVSCTKKQGNITEIKTEKTVKKTRKKVIVITQPGVYKYIDDLHEGCITWPNSTCYRAIIFIDSRVQLIGVNPDGGQDGNFKILTGEDNAGNLTVYKGSTQLDTTFTYFESHTTDGYNSIFSFK